MAVFAFTAFAAFYSCSSEDEDIAYITDAKCNSGLALRIDNALLEIMENKDGSYTEGGNICYFADEDALIVLDNWSYTLCSLIEEKTSENNDATRLTDDTDSVYTGPLMAPSGTGWRFAGTCKGAIEKTRLVKKLMNLIPRGKNFEIHVEVKSGVYSVWYRVLD